MKRHEPESIGDVIRVLLEESSLANRMEELRAARMWKGIVGDYIATQCSIPLVKKGVMLIGVPNASLRNELYISRSTLRQLINQSIGKEIITEIKFTS